MRPDLLGQGIGRALPGAVHDEAAGYRADGGAQSEEYYGVAVREVRYRRVAGDSQGGTRHPPSRR